MPRISATSITAAMLAMFAANVALAETRMKADAAPFLYTVVADKGEISEAGDDRYLLTLNKTAIKHVLEVSEAPFALENSISADDIVDTWTTGAGDFKGVAMKAWLLSGNNAILPINLTEIVKSDDAMRFGFFLPDSAMLAADHLGPLEDVTVVNYCCHPDDDNGEWLWGK